MSEQNYWWMFRFRLKRPTQGATDFYLDSLLACLVVKPVLDARGELALWRFHRRAADDDTGHQFSFICFTTETSAKDLHLAIEKETASLPAAVTEHIQRYFFEGPVGTLNERSTTSDPRWSKSLQKHWPEFIMGVSKLWLGLINDAYHAHDQKENLLELFKDVECEIGSLWKAEGQHALLHHLSALFGYNPVSIQRDILF